tara:strand:+ start:529 stop:1413 length:885 start_codon:yes stop_codon:yes gene_type:complete
MKNRTLNEEIRRTKEMMGLLNEQSLQMDFHIFETCSNGAIVAPVQNQQSLLTTQDWHADSVSFYQAMGSPSQGDIFKMDTTSDTTSAYQDATGTCLRYVGISSCSGPSTFQGGFSPYIHCSTDFGGAHYNNWTHMSDYLTCNDCTGGNTGVDCTQYGIDLDPTNPLINNGSFFPQGYTAYMNGNCNPILNKIQQVNNISNVDKKNCRLDYLNDLLIACQQGTATVRQTFINNMTSHHQQQGCYGNGGTQSNPTQNSVCNKKAHFCGMCVTGCSPMQQAKCDWLTDFITTNNCNC